MLCSLWDLSSLIRDQTWQWPLDLTSGPLGNSPNSFIYLEDYLKWCLHHIAHAPDSISNVCGGKLKRLLMAFGLPQALLGCFQQTTGKLVWRPARHHLIIISFPFAIAFTSPVTSAVKNSQCGSCRRCGFDPWVGKIPWRREQQPLQCYLLGNPMAEKPGGL